MSVCSKCSAEVPAGAQFCAACGTPVASAVAAPVPPPTQATYAPPPPASGGGAMKIVLIVIAVVLGLGILCTGVFGYFAWRVSRAVHHGPHGTVGIVIPGGTISAGEAKAYTAEELGAPLYPGAQSVEGGMRMETPGGSVVTGVFSTSDSKDTVRDFYKGKLGAESSLYDTPDGAIISGKLSDQETVMVTVSSKQSENDGKTKIVIVHTLNKKAS